MALKAVSMSPKALAARGFGQSPLARVKTYSTKGRGVTAGRIGLGQQLVANLHKSKPNWDMTIFAMSDGEGRVYITPLSKPNRVPINQAIDVRMSRRHHEICSIDLVRMFPHEGLYQMHAVEDPLRLGLVGAGVQVGVDASSPWFTFVKVAE